MNIETIPLSDVRPYWRNPRENSETVEKLKESISKYGFLVPLVVDLEGIILAGHARYGALTALGYEDVEVIRLDLPAEKAQAFRIADNRAGEFSEWDLEKLKSEMEALNIEEVAVFFDTPEWGDLLDMDALRPKAAEVSDVVGTATAGEATEEEEEEEESDEIALMCPSCLGDFVMTKEELQKLHDEQHNDTEEEE